MTDSLPVTRSTFQTCPAPTPAQRTIARGEGRALQDAMHLGSRTQLRIEGSR